MAIYRLEPISLNDPRWDESAVAETVWVAASTPARARQAAAEKTLHDARSRNPARLQSPWLLDCLTTCVLEQRSSGIPLGTVMISDGRTVSNGGISG